MVGDTLIAVAIVKKMYEETTASIEGLKAVFDVLVGCRLGGQESPRLCNYYFDYVLKVSAHEVDNAFPDGWGIAFDRWEGCVVQKILFCKSIRETEQLLNIINVIDPTPKSGTEPWC